MDAQEEYPRFMPPSKSANDSRSDLLPGSEHSTRTGKIELPVVLFSSHAELSKLIHKVGHEIGNPLTAIISFATVMERFGDIGSSISPGGAPLTDSTNVPQYARGIAAEAWKISLLNERLVLLLSDREPHCRKENILPILYRALSKAESRHGWDSSRARVSVHSSVVPLVSVDKDLLAILFVELFSNAFSELAAQGQRVVSRAAEERSADQASLQEEIPLINIDLDANDELVRLVISNATRPIPQSDLSELFEPFVSNDSNAKRLGIGLTLAAMLIRRIQGDFEVQERTNEHGRQFRAVLSFPVARQSASVSANDPPQTVEKRTAALWSGAGAQMRPVAKDSACLLIVENEPAVASAIQRIVEISLPPLSCSCQCLSGTEAVRWIESGTAFDCMLCDLNLAEMSGRHVYETLQSVRPQDAKKFAFITGEQARRETKTYLDSCARPYLIKPFEPEQLLGLIRSLLEK